MTFISYQQGKINSDFVAKIQWFNQRQVLLLKDGSTVEPDHDFLQTIDSIVTVHDDWECLYLADSQEEGEIVWEPVLSWGLTLDRHVVAITPRFPMGVYERYALRLRGTDTVYADGEAYGDLYKWIKANTKQSEAG